MMIKIKQLLIISAAICSGAVLPALSEAKNSKAEMRIPSFAIPQDMKVEVWASEKLTQNPGFFYFDTNGRLLIAELYRIYQGVEDIRKFSKDVTIADISINTLDDRLAMYDKYADQLPQSLYSKASDKIRLVEDTNNDGKADKAGIYAEGFNDVLDGLGAGVIERDGKVYYTNMPHLWLLEDNNNDGISDQRTSLQKGFGTRISFMGHDMHGLIWGPDGRLYWSMGDRGYHFTSKEGKEFFGPNQGAVFRSNPDGSNIELFYTGLRNPQELAFDEFGNLFTADNDGDHGDFERINHLIEGGDSGWDAGHQSIMSFSKRLAFNSYKYTGNTKVPVTWIVNDMSLPRNENQPAYILPSIGQLFKGPSGLTYNPSNYLGEKWRNTFFIAHFSGSPAGSYITTFKTKENGASFLATEKNEFLRGINVSDIDFGPDGRFYIAEFNFGGWENNNEGAIYALENKKLPKALVKTHQTYKTLLSTDYSNKTVKELTNLLSIDHQQIRQRAQFELAKRTNEAYEIFNSLAHDKSQDVFSRIHSIWGLSQLVFNQTINKSELTTLLPLLQDKNAQVRIQSARVLADHSADFAAKNLLKSLTDTNNQVAMYAALGLGKLNNVFDQSIIVNAIINKLKTIGDKDLWLRHSLTMALKGLDKKHWLKHKNHPSKDVRLGILLSLRLLKDADIAHFLNDSEQKIVNEAVTAIDDQAITSVRNNVAKLLDATSPAEDKAQAYMHHRIINANYNEGKIEHAKRLLTYAAHPGLNDRLASEALAAIEGWNEINPIDVITGIPTLANTQRDNIDDLIKKYLFNILANVKAKSLIQAMRLAGKVNFELSEKLVLKIVTDQTANDDIRIQALNLLNDRFNAKVLPVAIDLLKDTSTQVKTKALNLVMKNNHDKGLTKAAEYLSSKNITLQKIALSELSKTSKDTNLTIDNLITEKLTALLQKKHHPALALELISAAKINKNARVKALFAKYQASIQGADLITQFSTTLAGGDAASGKEIFYSGGAAQCLRCHKVNGQGSNVGPDLSNVGNQYTNNYLLEALVDPSGSIAPGYGNITLTLKDNKTINGLFRAETENTITIGKTKASQKTYKKSDIANIQRPVSGMPPMNYILSKSEVRDVLAFLQTLKQKKKAYSGH